VNKPPPLPPKKKTERVDPLVGRTISERYRIDAILAAGGMGTVYRGEHVHMHKRVAIKVLRPDLELFPELVSRFEREAIAGAHVDHPNVASATDFGRLADGSYFLILEYVPGITLHDLIRRGPVAPARAAHVARQIAAGLDACHRMGVIHRDLKPRNVMLEEERADLVKIIDFGLARVPMHRPAPRDDDENAATRHQITLRGIVFGTVAYMAPETALGMEAVDARSDLYALGVILYEMLAGRHPFDAIDPAELFLSQRATLPPPFAARAPGVVVPGMIESVVQRLLEKKPADRYASAVEAMHALDRAMLGSNPELETTPGAHSVSVRAALAHSGETSRTEGDSGATRPTGTTPSAEVTPTPVSSTRLPPPPAPPAASGVPQAAVARAALQSGRFRVAAVLGTLLLLAAALGSPWLRARPTAPPIQAEPMLGGAMEISGRVVERARAAEEAATCRKRLTAAQLGKDTRAIAAALTGLAEHDPAAFHEHDVAALASAVAIRLEFEGDPAAGDLFAAFGDRLGGDGADILYDIASTKGGSKGAKRANDILARADVRAHATPELQIALDLRDTRCDAKKSLFERAGREGDVRTFRLLERLRSPGSCSGNGQCCYFGSDGLEKAIAAIKRRL